MVYQITDHPTRNPDASVSDDGHYLLLNIFDGYDSNGFYYRDLRDDSNEVVKLLDNWDGLYQFLGNKGKTFFFETSAGAPLGRVIAIDLDKPQRKTGAIWYRKGTASFRAQVLSATASYYIT